MDPVMPREDRYGDLLAPGEAEYAPSPDDILTVRCIQMYNDIEIGKMMMVNEIFEVKRKRAEYLEGRDLVVIEE